MLDLSSRCATCRWIWQKKKGLSPPCQEGLGVWYNAVFILYVKDYNCLIFFFFWSNKHTMTTTQLWATDLLKYLPDVIVRWQLSGFMLINNNYRFVIIVNNFRDTLYTCPLFTTIFTLNLWSKYVKRVLYCPTLLYRRKNRLCSPARYFILFYFILRHKGRLFVWMLLSHCGWSKA